jgi:pyrroloquinoline quinone (PQQ) biosynthesis protein C
VAYSALGVDRGFMLQLLREPPDRWAELNSDDGFRRAVREACEDLVDAAYRRGEQDKLVQLHDVLAVIYERDFSLVPPDGVESETQPLFRDISAALERGLLERELADIVPDAVAGYPREGREYVRWLKRVIAEHPAGQHPFYQDFLVNRATADDIRFYLAQETNLDPRFDDILALMQVGTAGAEKMEIAGNYWDEMGNGKPEEVHTMLFGRALEALSVDDRYIRGNLLLEAKISGNLSSCLALSRRHFYKAVGFFGVTEYLVPRRFRSLLSGWHRLGLDAEAARYHDMHIGIDAVHASGWFKNVVTPAVERDHRVGREIALGTVMRLNSSDRYLNSLLTHLQRKA